LDTLWPLARDRELGRMSMRFTPTRLEEAYVVELDPRVDDRGFFARTFCRREFEEQGLDPIVAQSNLAFSPARGTLRGLHYQLQPMAEAKLVRCVRGAILDVVVDARPNSRTYLQHVDLELSAENRVAIYVPRGFAHGYETLAPDTEVLYQMSEFYSSEHERGLRYDDPALAIEWPLPVSVIPAKDAGWPLVATGVNTVGPV
jgi:dTDP-4-dehydrorhamnose 3,5-epimerase